MPDIWLDCDVNLAEVPVNLMPLIDDTDFKSIEGAVAYNAAGMALRWHFVTTAGAYTVTSVTPTSGGDYDWTDQGDSGIYTIEIPASGGASINNDTEGFGWFTGVATGILPWRGPVIGFRSSSLNNALIDGGAGTLPANVTEIAGDTVDTTLAQLGVNVVQISGDATAANNAESFFDGTGYAGTNNVIPTVTTLAAGAITSAVIATGAIDADALATDAVNEIADGILGRDASASTTNSTLGAIINDWENGGRLDLILDARASQTSVDTIDGIVDAILVDTAEIGVAGAGLTAADDAVIAAIAALNNLSSAQVTAAVWHADVNANDNTVGSFGDYFGQMYTETTVSTPTTLGTLATQASVNTIDDFLDTEIAAIKAKTDNLPAAPAAVGDIPTAIQNADALLNRSITNTQDTADTHSLTAVILATLESSISGTTWTIRKTGGTTFTTKTITVDAGADPITGVT